MNKAYDILLKPVPRALYLLERHGQSLEESDVHVDPVFLMDIMELNETISGAWILFHTVVDAFLARISVVRTYKATNG